MTFITSINGNETHIQKSQLMLRFDWLYESTCLLVIGSSIFGYAISTGQILVLLRRVTTTINRLTQKTTGYLQIILVARL